LLTNLRKYGNRARVHFIPYLKVGVFVTLCTPDVIILITVISPLLFHSLTQSCSYLCIFEKKSNSQGSTASSHDARSRHIPPLKTIHAQDSERLSEACPRFQPAAEDGPHIQAAFCSMHPPAARNPRGGEACSQSMVWEDARLCRSPGTGRRCRPERLPDCRRGSDGLCGPSGLKRIPDGCRRWAGKGPIDTSSMARQEERI
jgi:hypothetical protein